MNKNTQHYLRIHRRVWRRLWLDIPDKTRDTIANDVDHLSEEFKWFENKCSLDAERLFLDANYYDNLEHTFRIPTSESLFRQL